MIPPAAAADPALTTADLAARLGADLVGRADLRVTHVETLDRAGTGAISFIRDGVHGSSWGAVGAPAALVTRGVPVAGHDPGARALIVVDDADRALSALLGILAPPQPPHAPGVHPTALVDPAAALGAGVSIGPFCVVGAGASIGDGTALVARVLLERDVRIGRGCVLHAGVVVQHSCVIGDACILHPGVVIGADGFGYLPAPDGRGLEKIPHIGRVEIGRAVEIGANSCIDRAKFGATRIGDGTKIDNLVQIGHNCQIGRACVICGLTGLAGSVTLEDGVMLAGAVGIADNLRIGAGARVAGGSKVMSDIPAGQTYWGNPAFPALVAARVFSYLRRIGQKGSSVDRAQGRGAERARAS